MQMTPARHYLYRNRGDGTFEDATAEAGILRRDGRGLGVVAADVNLDGWIDLYVANDMCGNFLFLNRGDGTFEDLTEVSGAAVSEAGYRQASMGVDAEDVTGDGLPELFVTNFENDYNTLYRNLDGRNFQDVSASAGIVKDSLPYVGWGCALADLDNDGLPDMFVVNGHVDDNLQQLGRPIPQAEPALVWRNRGGGRFRLVARPGPVLRGPPRGQGRGLRRPGQRRRYRRGRQPDGRPSGGAPERVGIGPVAPPGAGRDAFEPRGDRGRRRRPRRRSGPAPAGQGGRQLPLGQRPPAPRRASARPIGSTRSRSAGPPGAFDRGEHRGGPLP